MENHKKALIEVAGMLNPSYFAKMPKETKLYVLEIAKIKTTIFTALMEQERWEIERTEKRSGKQCCKKD